MDTYGSDMMLNLLINKIDFLFLYVCKMLTFVESKEEDDEA